MDGVVGGELRPCRVETPARGFDESSEVATRIAATATTASIATRIEASTSLLGGRCFP
jgi:hypothetical protein